MTPATTLSKAYYNEKQYEYTKEAAATEMVAEEITVRKSLATRIEDGINWFSRNLTGQSQPRRYWE